MVVDHWFGLTLVEVSRCPPPVRPTVSRYLVHSSWENVARSRTDLILLWHRMAHFLLTTYQSSPFGSAQYNAFYLNNAFYDGAFGTFE